MKNWKKYKREGWSIHQHCSSSFFIAFCVGYNDYVTVIMNSRLKRSLAFWSQMTKFVLMSSWLKQTFFAGPREFIITEFDCNENLPNSKQNHHEVLLCLAWRGLSFAADIVLQIHVIVTQQIVQHLDDKNNMYLRFTFGLILNCLNRIPSWLLFWYFYHVYQGFRQG